jgi:hypothetical protein
MIGIPVGELDEEEIACAWCRMPIEDEAYYDGDANHFCRDCLEELVKSLESKAAAYTERNCRITRRPLPQYDPALEHRCTREYMSGYRESYTPNAYLTLCRHGLTNYDELIEPLDPDRVFDQVFYEAINFRIMSPISEAIEEDGISDEPADDEID